jgi:hypothetical protein
LPIRQSRFSHNPKLNWLAELSSATA